MKLGALKSAIRDSKVAPKVLTDLNDGRQLEIVAQKGPLLSALDETFPGGKAVETGIVFSETGYLVEETEG